MVYRMLQFRISVILCVLLFACASTVWAQDAAPPDPASQRLLSIAETQHEIVQLLIQKGDIPRALKELQVILDLNLPQRYEEAVYKEIAIVSRKLYERGTKDAAYQVLDRGFESLRTVEFKARILNLRAGLLKKDGRVDEAIQVYRQEIELRAKATR